MKQKKHQEAKAKSIKLIEGYVGQPGLSANKLATAIGITGSHLSSFISGRYENRTRIEAGIIDKIIAFFDLEQERRKFDLEPEFVLTSQSARIQRMIRTAHAMNTISVVHSSSGAGKTMTLKEYARRKNNVYYVQCNPFMRGRVCFVKTLCATLNIRTSSDITTKFTRLALEGKARGILILLDDVQVLSKDDKPNTTIFEVIRILHDQGLSFVLAGNNSLRECVTQTDHEEFYQQFASRSGIEQIPDTFSRADVGAVISAAYNGSDIKGGLFDYLFEVANEYYGSLRLVIRILEVAVPTASGLNMPLTLDLLKQASKCFVSQKKPQYKNKNKRGKVNAKTIDDNRKPIQARKEKRQPQVGVA